MRVSKFASETVRYGSIHEIYCRLQHEGYRVSEATLRGWVKEGLIPARKHWNRSMLLYDDVIAFLDQRLPPVA